MSQIPEDTLKTAQAVFENLTLGYERGAVEDIARAIIAERERCAGIADRRANALVKMRGFYSEVVELRTLAAAIRGEQ